MLNLSPLTSSELKFRKLWRKLFFIYNGFLGLIVLLISVASFFAEEMPDDSTDMSEALVGTLAICLTFILSNYIFYRCAYQKAGTKLLTLYIYLKPIDSFVKGFCLFFLPFPSNLILLSLLLVIAAIFYIMNWKLRKINFTLKDSLLSYPEDYLVLVESLKNSTLINERDNKYSSLVKEWPQFERYTTKQYRKLLKPTSGS